LGGNYPPLPPITQHTGSILFPPRPVVFSLEHRPRRPFLSLPRLQGAAAALSRRRPAPRTAGEAGDEPLAAPCASPICCPAASLGRDSTTSPQPLLLRRLLCQSLTPAPPDAPLMAAFCPRKPTRRRPHICHSSLSAAPFPRAPGLAHYAGRGRGDSTRPRENLFHTPVRRLQPTCFFIPADAEAAVGMGTGETLPIGKAVGAARHSIHSFLAVVSGGTSGRQDRCRRRCLAASRGEGPGSFKPWLFAAEAFVG
jgi:hypothetical protein